MEADVYYRDLTAEELEAYKEFSPVPLKNPRVKVIPAVVKKK